MVRQVVPVVDFRVPTEQGNTAFDGSILMVGRSIFKCFTACKVDVRYPGSPAQKIRANFPEKKHPHSNKRINKSEVSHVFRHTCGDDQIVYPWRKRNICHQPRISPVNLGGFPNCVSETPWGFTMANLV